MIQKLAGGLGPLPQAQPVQSRGDCRLPPGPPCVQPGNAEHFCAPADEACLSPTVVAGPDPNSKTKETDLAAVLDTSNLKPDQACQVRSELRAIPSQIWKMLARTGLRIVSLPPGQDLTETSAAKQFSPSDYSQRLEQAGECLQTTVQRLDADNQRQWAGMADSEMQQAFWAIQQGPIIAEEALAGSAGKELGFQPVVLSRPVSLDELQQAVGGEANPNFLTELQQLNGSLLNQEGQFVNSSHRVLLLPYPRCQGQPVPPEHLKYLKSQNDEMLRASMGTNYWQSALVVVHQEFLPDPAPEAGHHRVMLHEVGHAIDHLIDRIEDGQYGQEHRLLVNQLFERDKADAAKGLDRFSSPRAKDNPREYFAEAVESYLTRDRGDGLEPKPHNNHEWLKANNPELYRHVDEIFTRAYADDIKLGPMPERPEYKAPPGLFSHTQKPYLEL